MPSLRDRWRSGRPEFVILVGCLVAFAGNYVLIAWTLLATRPEAWAAPVGLAAIELALCVLTPLILARRRARTARSFALVGIPTTVIALLTVPGILGGGIALAGAMWGLIATYAGLPQAPAS